MTEEKKAEILGRLTYSQNFENVKGAFLVVEAVPEKIEIKKDTFKKVDELEMQRQSLYLTHQD